jgi:hypothetical protein
MKFKIKAIFIDGMKDFLTIKKEYELISENDLSFFVICDQGYLMHFAKCRFDKRKRKTY